jgi:hypothetical protein
MLAACGDEGEVSDGYVPFWGSGMVAQGGGRISAGFFRSLEWMFTDDGLTFKSCWS